MDETLLKEFVFLWTVVDPIGAVPVFIAVVAGYDAATQRKIAIRATVVSAAVLLFFILAGRLLLQAMSIELSAFQIAGGIIMFLFALDMVFGMSRPEENVKLAQKATNIRAMDVAVFPLAVPAIAGPGTMMAVVLLTDTHRDDVAQQARVAAVLMVVLAITLLFLFAAGRIQRLIGDAGASVVSRVMGMIIAALAASTVLAGIKAYFHL